MGSEEMLRQMVCDEHRRELSELPTNEELGKVLSVSERFYQRMQRLIQSQRRKSIVRRTLKNVASFFIAALATLLVLCAINEDVRAACLRWIKSVVETNGVVDYKPVSSQEEGKERITRFKLGYVPDGFEEAVRLEEENLGSLIYKKGDSELYVVYAKGDSTLSMDYEHSEKQQITLDDGTACDYYKRAGEENDSSIVWKRGDYILMVTIRSSVEGQAEEELLRIANGIQEITVEEAP